jgi:MOSC domain-containing protein YiiM
MEAGKVVALHRKPRPGALEPVSELAAVGGKGFVGDRCFGQARRQALFVALDQLEAFGYRPGDLREQVTVDFPGLQDLAPGTRLSAGEVEFEIEGDCAPCHGMAKHLGEDPQGFVSKISRRRGMLAKVLSDGVLRVGDEVRLLA